MAKRFKPSAILSLYTGRLYSDERLMDVVAPILETALGRNVYLHELPDLKKQYTSSIIEQCPPEMQVACATWKHDDDWRQKTELLDEVFGDIEICQC